MNTLKALFKQNKPKLLHLTVSLAVLALSRKFYFFLKTQYFHSLLTPFAFHPVKVLALEQRTLLLRKRRTLLELITFKPLHSEFRAILLGVESDSYEFDALNLLRSVAQSRISSNTAWIYTCPFRIRQGQFEIGYPEEMHTILYYYSPQFQRKCVNTELIHKAWAQVKDARIDAEQDEVIYDALKYMYQREKHSKKYQKGIWAKYKSSLFEKKYGLGGMASYIAEKREAFIWFMNRTK